MKRLIMLSLVVLLPLSAGGIEFFVNMGTYKSKYVSFRLIVTSILAVLLIFISISLVRPVHVIEKPIVGYLIAVIGLNCITELNIFFINVFKRLENYNKNIYAYMLGMLLITILVTYAFIVIAQVILGNDNLLHNSVTLVILILGLLILLIHLLVIVLSSITKVWIESKKEIDDLKETKLISDYNSLKDRLNPHFLFNNLSVLKSLIRYNPDDAEIFTQNFTNVYRYVLNSHEKKTVSLKSELDFIQSYIALHKERIGEGLNVSIDIKEEQLKNEIPPMTLQLLIENAIKHNVANKSQQLNIEVKSKDESIIVKNNINRKETTYSTQTGLTSLKAQYRLLANKEVNVIDNGVYFTVEIYLI